ncbi:exonuclease domain-containing protein [Saccharothrix sp. ST-888]|uniref:exonuclease domain-containing protein n=1 Tax=Saccharothrix sp. ST-888 TaxID=1427391 RepID=UPI0005ED40DC|nr:exonuclease domain-containing protein [Saccharothrix sp. ST-888]KJK59697.1 DNA polymerase III subunit epsilon [Saccharothrix sp. ST-888]
MSWWKEPLVGFDLETTGTDPAHSRIVTAALVDTLGGRVERISGWLVDPGVPIPAEAAAIHGITDEQARTHGRPAAEAVEEIAAALCARLALGHPVVAFNAPFDLSLLDAELRRHGRPPLAERLGGAVGPVVDALVIDRSVDRYRKGSRTLQHVCEVYGVELADAHEAGSDALAAVRVAVALGERYPAQVGDLTPEQLHVLQIDWHRSWAEGLQAWLRKGKDVEAVIDPRWPLR